MQTPTTAKHNLNSSTSSHKTNVLASHPALPLITYRDLLLRASLSIDSESRNMMFTQDQLQQAQLLAGQPSKPQTAKPALFYSSAGKSSSNANAPKTRPAKMIGKPLMPPPAMPRAVMTRDQAYTTHSSKRAAPQEQTSSKKRRLEDTAHSISLASVMRSTAPSSLLKTLSSDEQVFVEAAQRLHELPKVTKPASSSSSSARGTQVTPEGSASSSPTTSPRLALKALKRPPSLHL